MTNYNHKKIAYKCHNAVESHGFQLHFDEQPPDRCPRCNAVIGRCSLARLAETKPINPRPQTLV